MPDRRRQLRTRLERMVPRGSPSWERLRALREIGSTVGDAVEHGRWSRRRRRAPEAAAPAYAEWLEQRRPGQEDLRGERRRVEEAAIGVGVDCLVLARDGGDLNRTLASLKSQTLPNWSARVAGAPPPRADRRIAPAPDEEDAALEQLVREGEPRSFLLVIEAGDVLEPNLFFNVAAHGWDDPSVDLVHWDDDELGPDGRASNPLMRPSWSPDMLLSANYLGRSFSVRRERVAAAGGFGSRSGAARWWDLLLRLELSEAHVARVPKVLAHLQRRAAVAVDEAVSLVDGHLKRSGRSGEAGAAGGAVRVRWRLQRPASVSIVIPTRSRETLLARCLEGIARTDHADFEVVVVDTGKRDSSAERFYAAQPIDIRTVWWEGPFNYSAANNLGARESQGELLVFLNDDTDFPDPGWLAELAGWASQPGVGLVGLQLLDAEGAIQHGGVVVGMNGFADHLFAGMPPGSDSLLGSTTWYRNSLSVTAACAALERELFEEIGGFDERFLLCGSDVVLGLDSRFLGRRNVCSPYGGVRHLEGKTRGEAIPRRDFFTSYWRYQRWLRAGDPYFSPNLSLQHTEPRLRGDQEPDPLETVGGALRHSFTDFAQRSDEDESRQLAEMCRADPGLRGRIEAEHAANAAPFEVETVNWFTLALDSPFYGGVNTALRIAEKLARDHGVRNRFVVAAEPNEDWARSAIGAAFPSLADSEIAFSDGRVGPNLDSMPAADVSIATQWHTAYLAANFPHTRRRFYLIQDFEPMFYPAGTNYALAEESYRFGLYGICNTERILSIYRDRYGGEGSSFMPAVDASVFHAEGRRKWSEGDPVTLFAYARPGHWRNCWELAAPALAALKRSLGQEIRILTAGSWARPDDLGRGIEHLGLLDYRDTGELYRSCDIGLALTVSEHPSYLPLELLACGVPVVAFDNPAGDWILRHRENSIRCPRTVDGLLDGMRTLAADPSLRARLSEQGVRDIGARHADWDAALAGVYPYLCEPS